MSRCTSCNNVLSPYEMIDKIELEDGTLVDETFCTECKNKYVWNADKLPTKEYAFEHITEELYHSEFTTYSE